MKKRFRIPLLLMLAVFLISGLIGFAGAKYVTKISHRGKVTFSASLAENVQVLENQPDRQDDGSYVLTGAEVETFLYDLLPGHDIPKNPFVKIVNKTTVPAYLFVEVVETLDEDILFFQVDTTNWKKLEATPKHGGTVYVYTGGGQDAAVLTETLTKDAAEKTVRIPILALLQQGSQDTVRVSQKLLKKIGTETQILEINAYLIEKTGTAKPEDAYNGYPAA